MAQPLPLIGLLGAKGALLGAAHSLGNGWAIYYVMKSWGFPRVYRTLLRSSRAYSGSAERRRLVDHTLRTSFRSPGKVAIALADSAAVMYGAAKGLLSDALDLAAFCSCDGTADCKGQSAVTSRCRCIPSFALLALLICFAHLLCCSLQSAICSGYGLP